MKKQLVLAGLVVAGLVLTIAVTTAQGPGGPEQGQGRQGGGPGGPGRPGRGGGPGMNLAGLDLTAEQQEQVKALFESERESNQSGQQAIGEARQALNAAIFANTVDQGAVAALQAKIIAAEQAQLSREVQSQLTLSGILTPEQRAKVAARNGRGPGRGGPRRPH